MRLMTKINVMNTRNITPKRRNDANKSYFYSSHPAFNTNRKELTSKYVYDTNELSARLDFDFRAFTLEVF